MNVLAALGDASTAVIAVVAILLGILVVARGQRGEGTDRGDEPAGPSLLTAPGAAPAAADDGLEKMAVHDVGHGTIRLGGVASPHTEPGAEAVWTPAPVVEPEPGVDAEAVAEPDAGTPAQTLAADPGPAGEPEPAVQPQPPTSWTPPYLPSPPPVPPAPAADMPEPPAEEPPPAPEPPPSPAPAADPPSQVGFRQGTIRLRKPPGQ